MDLAAPAARPSGRARAGRCWAAVLALAAVACTTSAPGTSALRGAQPAAVPAELAYEPVPLEAFQTTPEGITVSGHFLVHLYTFFHRRDYSVSRVEFPAHEGGSAVAHWFAPQTPGPHPAVLVFPILAGSHVVSELVAKALVRRGFAVAQLERKELALETAQDPDVPSRAMRAAVRDARRLLDWVQTRPEVDRQRIAAAGISLGSLLACLLQGADPRVRAGVYLLTGGGVAELLYDSSEAPVRAFRDRLVEQGGYADRDAFLAAMRPLTGPIEPLALAANIAPESVLIASGRLDRVMPRARTQALWEALGQPRWIRLPFGHYQSLPFLWWTVARGADHLDAYFASPAFTQRNRAAEAESESESEPARAAR